MFKQVIALGLLPLLVACNSSDSNTNGGNDNGGDGGSIIVPGEPGIDIDGPDSGGDGDGGTSGLPSQLPGFESESFDPDYKKASINLGLEYQDIEAICDTDYSEFLDISTQYFINCDWKDQRENFVISYTEIENKESEFDTSGASTIQLVLNNDFINRQEIGINAYRITTSSADILDINEFNFLIRSTGIAPIEPIDHKFNFDYKLLNNGFILLSENEPNMETLYITNLNDAENKRFELHFNPVLDSGQVDLSHTITNTKLFGFVYQALRYY
ncbi:hypothetical protein [Vibrio breoganii]|uniref:hypothetical protein n=1 Tax=Vibrio breoganii TaxID=553239 RepID=UPI0021C2A3D1|nr:hypothetical protein [Vibrio breoganii]MDN3715075.1 hypothetical protein [Vibrio breoganii]